MFVYARAMTSSAPSAADRAQRAILDELLDRRDFIDLERLTAQLGGVPDVDHHVRMLGEDGLVTRLGDMVGASRAARRFCELGL